VEKLTSLTSKTYRHFMGDSLYRNSIFLLLSTYVQAGFGFFFWLIASHLYAPSDVGLATALISALSLLSTISLLGMDNSLIRYFSTNQNTKKFINFAFSVVTIGSLIAGIIYVLGIHIFSRKLLFVGSPPSHAILSIFIVLASSLYTISDYVFIALKQSGYVFAKSIILSIVKLILPLVFLSEKAYGLFLATGIAMLCSFLFSVIILAKNNHYRFRPSLDKEYLKLTYKFAGSNYVAGLLESLPASILPILIVNHFPAKNAAYFYIAFMVANLLYRIPVVVTQSFFAASADKRTVDNAKIIHALKTLGLFLLPAIAVLILCGHLILILFGKSYASGGSTLLIYFSVAAIPISAGYILETILRIQHKNKKLVSSSLVRAISILLISYGFTKMGLSGIGAGWLIGQCVAAGWLVLIMRKELHHLHP
jgi:O-antigen/teichoic acid export membrane protein